MANFWYTAGTVIVSGKTVTGKNTKFLDNVREGDIIGLPDGKIYCVANVVSDTQITLTQNYGQSDNYFVVPAQGHDFKLSEDIADLIASYEQADKIIKPVKDGAILSSNGLPTKKQGDVLYDRDLQILTFWQTVGSFTGYVSNQIGNLVFNPASSPKAHELLLDGRTVSKSAYPALYNWAVANGLRVQSGWEAGNFYFGEAGGDFKLPDLRDQFIRFSGEDRRAGTKQGDAMRNIVGHLQTYDQQSDGRSAYRGPFIYESSFDALKVSTASNGLALGEVQTGFDASLAVPTANENRPRNTAVNPYIVAF